jgi:hypothetical protein
MKQLLQQVSGGEIEVVDVPAPKLLPGCVLVSTAASLVSVGTERAPHPSCPEEPAPKGQDASDLVREVWNKVVGMVWQRLWPQSAAGWISRAPRL